MWHKKLFAIYKKINSQKIRKLGFLTLFPDIDFFDITFFESKQAKVLNRIIFRYSLLFPVVFLALKLGW